MRWNQSGSSLVSVLVGVGITGLIAAAMAHVFGNGLKAQKGIENRGDIDSIRATLSAGIDCNATFTNAGIDPAAPGSSCTSTSTTPVGPWLQLYRRTWTGASAPLDAAWNSTTGAQKVGTWSVRASCSASEQSLIIQAARVLADGSFAKDPLSGKAWDWSNPRGLIFGAVGGAIPVCLNAGAAGNNPPVDLQNPRVRVVVAQGGIGPNMIATASCAATETFVNGDCQCHASSVWLQGFYAAINGYQCSCYRFDQTPAWNAANIASFTRARSFCYLK